VVLARWRFRFEAGAARMPIAAEGERLVQGLRTLQRIAESDESSPDLRSAIQTMDHVTMKLIDAIDLEGKMRARGGGVEPSARQALVLSRVQAELGRFSDIISNILGGATVNSLPLARLLRKGGSAPAVALDIGGTLTKILLLERVGDESQGRAAGEYSTGWDPSDGARGGERRAGFMLGDSQTAKGRGSGALEGRMSVQLNDRKSSHNSLTLQLYSFESANISEVVAFLRSKGISNASIPATGGGCHKFAALFARELGVTLTPNDEMRSVITGVDYRLLTGAAEAYQYKWGLDEERKAYVSFSGARSPFPYLLVNIGSGTFF
jgi:hypothetical protein